MPLPTPHKNEKEKDFISRCMSEVQGEFKDQKQRLAVCYGQWRNKQKQSKSFEFDLKIKESKLISKNSKKSGKTEKRIVVVMQQLMMYLLMVILYKLLDKQ